MVKLTKEQTFYLSLCNRLAGEVESRGLTGVEQINQFCSQALHTKYGHGASLNLSSVVAEVFKLVHTGTKDLPELPSSLMPTVVISPEINSDIVAKSKGLVEQYRTATSGTPKIDQILQDASIALGLKDKTGMILKVPDEVDQTKLAKITSVTAHVMAGEFAPALNENDTAEDGFKPLVDAVNAEPVT